MEYVSGAQAAVQAVGNRIEFVLTVEQEVGAFGQITAHQLVGFFAGIALPGTVRLQKSTQRCRGTVRPLPDIRQPAVDWRQLLNSQQENVSPGGSGMSYAKEFFDLQLEFAGRVSELGAIPLQVALLDFTNLYVRFVGDRKFDGNSPVWTVYVAGLGRETDLRDWTYRFYRHMPHRVQPASVVGTFGCFSYAIEDSDRIRLHFHNADEERYAPLSDERLASRLSELTSLINHVRSQHTAVRRVAGVSWLYNLPAYRRLFPECYVATATVAENRFRNTPLWGQFLNRHGRIRKDAVALFTRRLTDQTSMNELAQCFPLQPLSVAASIEVFHKFYA